MKPILWLESESAQKIILEIKLQNLVNLCNINYT